VKRFRHSNGDLPGRNPLSAGSPYLWRMASPRSNHSPVIYFAGSIRGGRDDAAIYGQIIEKLRQFGHVHTEHVGSATLTDAGEAGSAREIHDRDLDWLRSSDFIVAEVTTPSLGVGYEIARATEWGKKVLCLFRRRNDNRGLSAMIAGCPDVVVREYETVTETDDILADFFSDAR